jgi:hypothetical protein
VLLRQACHDHKQLLDALVDAHILAAFHNKRVLPAQRAAARDSVKV